MFQQDRNVASSASNAGNFKVIPTKVPPPSPSPYNTNKEEKDEDVP